MIRFHRNVLVGRTQAKEEGCITKQKRIASLPTEGQMCRMRKELQANEGETSPSSYWKEQPHRCVRASVSQLSQQIPHLQNEDRQLDGRKEEEGGQEAHG